jgi:hypothetical protein
VSGWNESRNRSLSAIIVHATVSIALSYRMLSDHTWGAEISDICRSESPTMVHWNWNNNYIINARGNSVTDSRWGGWAALMSYWVSGTAVVNVLHCEYLLTPSLVPWMIRIGHVTDVMASVLEYVKWRKRALSWNINHREHK